MCNSFNADRQGAPCHLIHYSSHCINNLLSAYLVNSDKGAHLAQKTHQSNGAFIFILENNL